MYIAIVDFDVDPPRRAEAVDHLLTDAKGVRAMAGNQAFRVYADPERDTRITIVHEWDSRADMDVYLGSRSFADFGSILRKIMTGTPVSRRFEAQLAETV
jgi:quinol monooxygenase YgiN